MLPLHSIKMKHKKLTRRNFLKAGAALAAGAHALSQQRSFGSESLPILPSEVRNIEIVQAKIPVSSKARSLSDMIRNIKNPAFTRDGIPTTSGKGLELDLGEHYIADWVVHATNTPDNDLDVRLYHLKEDPEFNAKYFSSQGRLTSFDIHKNHTAGVVWGDLENGSLPCFPVGYSDLVKSVGAYIGQPGDPLGAIKELCLEKDPENKNIHETQIEVPLKGEVHPVSLRFSRRYIGGNEHREHVALTLKGVDTPFGKAEAYFLTNTPTDFRAAGVSIEADTKFSKQMQGNYENVLSQILDSR